MSGNFNDDEIFDLIAELGHVIELCVPDAVQAANSALGIPERRSLSCRQVRGYMRDDRQVQYALLNSSAPAQSYSGLLAVLSAADVTREELGNADARLKYGGKAYQFEYRQEYFDQGESLLHELRLTILA
jgi:hypothetical protein